MQAVAHPARPTPAGTARIQSVDLLRGIVMVIMALDHVRDFFHVDALRFPPEDLVRSNAALFFTRWITHFCAPVFVFLAGVSVCLASSKWGGPATVSRRLLTRGLWLILLEFTVMEFAWTFNLRYQVVVLQVLWMIGWSMLVLAALIWLPRSAILALSIAVIALHNLLDGVRAAQFGNWALLWNILHQPTLVSGRTTLLVAYPLIPWIGVMAAGYCFGAILALEASRRRAWLVRLGLGLTLGFLVLRFANVYGDPAPWSIQPRPGFTVISFLRVTKYPPSLQFLLMTLGPAILALGLLDRVRVRDSNPLRVFGRVPMFYFLLHFILIHALAVLFSGLRYGRPGHFLHAGPLLGVPDPQFPADWGYSLAVVYLLWLGVVIAMYLPCRWYMRVRERGHRWWLSYL